MLPALSTQSAPYRSASNQLPDNRRASTDPKLAELERITPADLRDEYLGIIRNDRSTVEEKYESFNKLHDLAPADIKPLFAPTFRLERDAYGNEFRWIRFVFDDVEISRSPAPPSRTATTQSNSAQTSPSQMQRSRNQNNASFSGYNTANKGNATTPLPAAPNPLNELVRKNLISQSTLDSSLPLSKVLTSPYVAWCFTNKFIDLKSLAKMANKIDTYYDFRSKDPSDGPDYLLVHVQTTFLDNFNSDFKIDKIKGFAAYLISVCREHRIPFFDLLVFVHHLKSILEFYGIDLSTLTATELVAIFGKKELLTNLGQLKKNNCLGHEQLKLSTILGWSIYSGQIRNLNAAFNGHPWLLKLIDTNKMSVMLLASLSPSEFETLDIFSRDAVLMDLCEREKVSVDEVLSLNPEKLTTALKRDVYPLISSGELSIKRAVTMSEWQKENIDNPLVKLSTVFTSIFS